MKRGRENWSLILIVGHSGRSVSLIKIHCFPYYPPGIRQLRL